ncbi:hypothetical protein CDD83_2637 [Cordyceps sp. RAO-2017]|nr:hypothetical protein CDD83_2637 [Cordyceps sp. RAO-2017]
MATNGLDCEDLYREILELTISVGTPENVFTEQELIIMGHQIIMFYNRWNMMTSLVQRDVDLLHFFWKDRQRGSEMSDALKAMDLAIRRKQASVPRDDERNEN